MLNIPVEVKELLKTNSTPKNFRVIFPNGERDDIINDSIVAESVHFTESVMSQDKFKLGLCESPVIEFEVFGIENIKGKKIECYYEIYCEDTVDGAVYREDLDAYVYPIPLGVFYVDSCKKEAKMNMRRVIAYGLQAYTEWKPPKSSYAPVGSQNTTMDLLVYIVLALQSDEIIAKTKIDGEYSYRISNNSEIEIKTRTTTPNQTLYSRGLYHTIPSKNLYLQLYTHGEGYSTYNRIQLTVTKELYHILSDKVGTRVVTGNVSTHYMKYTKFNKNRDFSSLKTGLLNYLNDLISVDSDSWVCYLRNYEFSSSHPLEFSNVYVFPNSSGVQLNQDYSLSGVENYFTLVANNIASNCDIRLTVKKDYMLEFPSENIYAKDANGSYRLLFTGGAVGEPHTLSELINLCERRDNWDLSPTIQNANAYLSPVYTSEWLNGNIQDNWQYNEGEYSIDNPSGISVNQRETIDRETMQRYIENLTESSGKIGRFTRYGEFEAFTIDTATLVPNDTDLVPSESLVPNGADVDTIYPSEYETAWYDDELSLPYGACSATHKVSGTDTYTIVYADGYNANTDISTYQIYDISDNDLVKEMTVEEITPILTTIITNLSNLRYMPSDIDMVGRPDIEAGDGIQVMSNSGAFNTYVLSRTIDGIQGLSDTITAK